jgi:hypothetical protein
MSEETPKTTEERPYPTTGDTLFQGGLHFHLNADISYWNKDLSGYANGYKEAADLIVLKANESERSFDVNISYLIFPVVFLYRQYIELRLKEIIFLGAKLRGGHEGFPKHHRIDELWKHARPFIKEMGSGLEEALQATDTCINEFSDLDPDGMAFRYPSSKDGKPHLPEWSVINIGQLYETMEKIGHLLDDAAEIIYIGLQQLAEFHGEY